MSFDVSTVSDPRIGYRTPEGQIVKKPTQYANGVVLEGLNYVPTTVFFGPNKSFFYYLPILVGAAPEALRKELEDVVSSYLPKPEKETKVKADKKIEDAIPKSGENEGVEG